MIAIIDGCGSNIASIQFALERLGKKSLLTTDVDIIKAASRVILPGVGTAKQAMKQLKDLQLIDIIRQLQQPVLGICLGMQILYEYSNEGDVNCLSLLSGKIQPILLGSGLTIPHMGWNQLQINCKSASLVADIKDNSYVYFVHSYVAAISHHTVASTQHGTEFSAIVQNKNFYGVQFHPEKSGETGEKILRNFLEL